MFRRNALITIALAAVVLLSSAPYGQADEYKTTLTLRRPRNPDLINEVVYYWSTNVTSGTVGAGDLVGLSMELWGGGYDPPVLIYTDTILTTAGKQYLVTDNDSLPSDGLVRYRAI